MTGKEKENGGLVAHLKKHQIYCTLILPAAAVLVLVWLFVSPELAKFIAYLLGGGMLIWQISISSQRAVAAEETASAMQKTAELTEKGNVAERFKNAIEHLGHDSASIRLGGIYALHYIAKEEINYRERIFAILCAHIRETTTQKRYKPRKKSPHEQIPDSVAPTIEIESILKLLFIRFEGLEDYPILPYAYLENSDLRGANLFSAKLEGAFLGNAKLQDICLHDAYLEDAYLNCSNLRWADFRNADLRNASFPGVDFTNAQNLTVEQLLSAKTLYMAKLPAGMEEEIRQRKPELFDNPYP